MKKAMNGLFFSSYVIILLFTAERIKSSIAVRDVKVGVVLDYSDRVLGQMGLSCIRLALSEFYASHNHYNTRLRLHTRDSNSDVVGAAAAALDLITNEKVQAIIGPITSTQANFVVDLGEKAQVPIVSYSASSPSLIKTQSSYFFRATQNAAFQVKVISSLVQAFGWKQVVLIYADDEYGQGLIPFLTDALLEVDTLVPYRSIIPPSPTGDQISDELHKLMTMQTRVFIVHTNVSLGTQIFNKAKDIGMTRQGYVWIVTNAMTNLISSMEYSSMNRVIGIKTYVRESKGVRDFRARWKREFKDDELNVFGLWAYDAAKALAMAVEEVEINNGSFAFNKTNNNIFGNSSTDLDTFGVSLNGPKLRRALLDMKFKGLAGNFSLVNGQLHPSSYQIINIVNGDGENVIGFWTPQNGLVRNLRNSSSEFSTSKDNLGPIMWPGESKSVPKGWEIPTNGKRLRVGVPLRGGFKEFVDVTYNRSTNTIINITGYCIEIFEAVIKALPYNVDYEFIPFVISSFESAGTYDDLVYQVHLEKYDAVVGDVTIRANRSLYVDFTLPYTESGLSMLVLVKDNRNKSGWVFLKPLTWDLWAAIACFFVFIGFVVWVLEHRINQDFRGPPLHQVGTSFWFSFSTMVFAHRERVISNLARFVVIIWVFVVLILTQSYTASLTSLLTAQQLQPNVTNVSKLLKNGDNVGYFKGSYVYGLLKSLGFSDSQLKAYESPEELNQALSDYSTSHDGIAAAFDEIPYLNLFLKRYCSKYSLVEPTFKADGFGFVFPRGSPLVRDVSRAILQVTEGEAMTTIKNKWFGTKTSCPDPNNTQIVDSSSNSLGLESFWGLFLIAGVSSLCALAIHAAMFFHGQRHVIMSSNTNPQEASMWGKVRLVFRIFDQKDLSSHTFRKSCQLPNRRGSTVEEIGNTSSQPSPSVYSNHADF